MNAPAPTRRDIFSALGRLLPCRQQAALAGTSGTCRPGLRGGQLSVRAFACLAMLIVPQLSTAQQLAAPLAKNYSIPTLDLSGDTNRRTVVDREPGQYLGHPTTVLLEDQRTMIAVYPKGHGRGAIQMKRSADAGKTWSDRLPTPASWATSLEVPTIHRTQDAQGKRRLIMWSGLHPARLAVSEDDGLTWSELAKAGDWGGIVVMGFVESVRDRPGSYLAMFHDDGRFFPARPAVKKPVEFTLYKTFSRDGGLTWSFPEAVLQRSDVHLCEPGCLRSPDGKQLAVLLRENSRRRNSFVIFSDDEGVTWSEPRELPAALTGDRHTGKYAPDGRLLISFRDTTHISPTKGDWVAWVGTYDDIVHGRQGQYRVRLMDNHRGADCAYPAVEVLPDGEFVLTTYGHWVRGEAPFVASVRLRLDELDAMTAEDQCAWRWDDLPATPDPLGLGGPFAGASRGVAGGGRGQFPRRSALARRPQSLVRHDLRLAARRDGLARRRRVTRTARLWRQRLLRRWRGVYRRRQ